MYCLIRIFASCWRIDARWHRAAILPKAISVPALAALLTACATQPAALPNVPGFAAGFFHGFVAIGALIASLYFHIRIYAFPNSGFWYDAGFVLGFGLSTVLVFLWLLPRIGGFFTRGN